MVLECGGLLKSYLELNCVLSSFFIILLNLLRIIFQFEYFVGRF